MMEGDLLEVALDETQHIWRILQACYNIPNRLNDSEVSLSRMISYSENLKDYLIHYYFDTLHNFDILTTNLVKIVSLMGNMKSKLICKLE